MTLANLQRQRMLLLLVVLLLPLLAGCGNDAPPAMPGTSAIFPTAGRATPTLDAAIALNPPTPRVTPAPDGAGVPPPPTQAPPTLSPTPAPPTATPSATPQPAEAAALGLQALANEDFAAAAALLSISLQAPDLTTAEAAALQLALARARLALGQTAAAIPILTELAAAEPPAGPQSAAPDSTDHPAQALFFLGEAQFAAGDISAAVTAWQGYLERNPDLAAYVEPRLAAAYLLLGDEDGALLSRQTAAAAPAERFTAVDNINALGARYLSLGRYAEASATYLSILDVALTEQTRGQAVYNAADALRQGGDEAGALALYLDGVTRFPRARESYLGLVELVNAAVPVDEFQRGLVNYFAGAYVPATEAFTRYLAGAGSAIATPTPTFIPSITPTATVTATATVSGTLPGPGFNPEAYLYRGWSYEGLGQVENAVADLSAYGRLLPASATREARAQIETARLYVRAGAWAAARAAFETYVVGFPAGADAPEAAWWAARLAELAPDLPAAVAAYRLLAESYPQAADAPRALYRAAFLDYTLGETEAALELWQTLSARYPDSEPGAAARIWLMRTGLPEAALAAETASRDRDAASYYIRRANDLADDIAPFAAVPADFSNDPALQREAETWLRTRLGIAPETPIRALSPVLASDPRLLRGEKLWALGLRLEARRELEPLRVAFAGNALVSYQLALAFRDLGLYRSMVLAGEQVLLATGTSPFSAPRFIGRLAYPALYLALILPEAEKYGYDPLLQLALMRQESLFESFISSSVGAQGLSQVMPATGDYIAGRLGWPDYTSADLTRPVVSVPFGAYYLDEQLTAFGGTVHAALAAYNAGPGNATRWFREAGDDLDLFVEIMDFPETRLYIERIYVGQAVYRYLYAGSE